MSNKKFQIIVADCPWKFSDKLQHSDVARGADANYSTMSISDIKQLPIKSIISPDGAILALWVPSSLLQDGLDVMKAWGFAHKQTYVWVKTKKDPYKKTIGAAFTIAKIAIEVLKPKNRKTIIDKVLAELKLNNILAFGMGRLFRQTHEICLIGTSNNKIYKILENKSQRSVSFAQNLKHSAKPENLQDSLDIMFPKAKGKIELFARRQRSGWTCIGNEICNGEDITVSLSKL
jgi:N6-adenosine-specific RNA methylase IME4